MRKFLFFAAFISTLASISFSAIIKSGDVIDVIVQGHPDYSGRFTLSDAGTIEYPLLADEPLLNISTSELMNHLTFKLAKYIDNPLVTISIIDEPEITILCVGQVNNPGTIKTNLGVTIQEALKLAGGTSKNADLERIKILHKGKADYDAEIFNLDSFMIRGDFEKMPILVDDDRIVVLTKKESTKVKVIGDVVKPGFYELTEPTTLFEIIYLAGGPAEKADLTRIRRIYKHEGKSAEDVINLQAFIDNGSMDQIPFVAEGDVVIVYPKWFDWKTLMAVLQNSLLFIVTIQAFRGAFK